MFGIVGNLVIYLLLGTSFISKVLQGMFDTERRIVTFTLPLILILAIQKVEADRTEKQKDESFMDGMDQHKFQQELARMTRTATIEPLTELRVLLTAYAKGIIKFTPSNI